MSKRFVFAVTCGLLLTLLCLLPASAAPLVLPNIPGLSTPEEFEASALPSAGVVVIPMPTLSQPNVQEGQSGSITYLFANLTSAAVDILGWTNIGSTVATPDPTDGVTNTFIVPGGCLVETSILPGQGCFYSQVFNTAMPDAAGDVIDFGRAFVFNQVRYAPANQLFNINTVNAFAMVTISDIPEPPALILAGFGLLALGTWRRHRGGARATPRRTQQQA